MEGGVTNLIFLAELKVLALSEGDVLIHVHAQQPLSRPLKVPFLVLL